MARRGRRRWAILFRRGAMTEQPNTRRNTRMRDRLRFATAPTGGSLPDVAVVSYSSMDRHRTIPGIGSMSVPGDGPEVEGSAPKRRVSPNLGLRNRRAARL